MINLETIKKHWLIAIPVATTIATTIVYWGDIMNKYNSIMGMPNIVATVEESINANNNRMNVIGVDIDNTKELIITLQDQISELKGEVNDNSKEVSRVSGIVERTEYSDGNGGY